MSAKLSERMTALAAMVTPGSRLADVGCDHAYIPIALCGEGRIPSAIAMDVRDGPLIRAQEHIKASGWDDRIKTRRSDGIEELQEDEADTVMIAGMGGLLIRRILTEHAIPASVTELILAPQSEISDVRSCIRELGFSITDEDMVLEDGKYYPIIKAQRGLEKGTDNHVNDLPEPKDSDSDDISRQEMEDAFGPILLKRHHPVLYRWLEKERDVTDGILARLDSELAAAPDSAHLADRRDEMRHRNYLITVALESYQ